MYFPILRGKRFELLALRETAEVMAQSGKFFPIIEPVRENTVASDLLRAMESLASHGVYFGVVIDPLVGDFKGEKGPAAILSKLTMINDWQQQFGAHITLIAAASPNAHQSEATRLVLADDALKSLPFGVWCTENFEVGQLGLAGSGLSVGTFIAPEQRMLNRLIRGLVPSPNRVLVEDRFPAQASNRAYVERHEAIFTEDHLYYSAEGLEGFADFLTIGQAYREGGGMPNVVAIHWTYAKKDARDDDGFPVYLSHFCSDPSDEVADVATKYRQASQALLAFVDENGIASNPALQVLREYAERGDFPGLGMLKKLSIVNHLHVMAGVM